MGGLSCEALVKRKEEEKETITDSKGDYPLWRSVRQGLTASCPEAVAMKSERHKQIVIKKDRARSRS